MLKFSILFFISMLIISCGGEVGTVYHNGSSSNNNGSNISSNSNTSNINCVPGAECIKRPSPIPVEKSNTCLPGVECNPLDTSNTPDTNSSSSDTKKDCLPGAVC